MDIVIRPEQAEDVAQIYQVNKLAFKGTQNLDWKSLAQVEIGLKLSS